MASWAKGFAELTAKTHTEQAIWFLNGFWNEFAEEKAEEIFTLTNMMVEIETGQKVLYGKRAIRPKEGCDLDEMKSHVFLEKMGETLTVRELRKRLKELDIDNNNRMALCEYLLAKFDVTPEALVKSPQGDGASEAELAEAQAALNNCMELFNQVSDALESSKAALKKAKEDEAASKTAAETAATTAEKARQAEADLKAAEEALREAVEELKKQEDAFNAKISELESIANDENAGAVKKNKAKNELAQMHSEDPLPLRRAKITQNAALKRAERARKPFADATAAAEADAVAAKAAAVKAQAAAKDAAARKSELEAKVAEADAAVAAAKEQLEELRTRGGGVPQGYVWWLSRELQEAEKYMPRK